MVSAFRSLITSYASIRTNLAKLSSCFEKYAINVLISGFIRAGWILSLKLCFHFQLKFWSKQKWFSIEPLASLGKKTWGGWASGGRNLQQMHPTASWSYSTKSSCATTDLRPPIYTLKYFPRDRPGGKGTRGKGQIISQFFPGFRAKNQRWRVESAEKD